MVVDVDVTLVGYKDVERFVVCYIVTTVTGRMYCFLLHGSWINRLSNPRMCTKNEL